MAKTKHRAYMTEDRGIWTLWAADVCGSEQGVPLGYIVQDFDWSPDEPAKLLPKGFRVSLMGDCWRNQESCATLVAAQTYILQNHHFKDIEASFN